MKLLRVHPEAEAEAAGASDWYAARSIPAALRFDSQLKSILQFPQQLVDLARGFLRRLLGTLIEEMGMSERHRAGFAVLARAGRSSRKTNDF